MPSVFGIGQVHGQDGHRAAGFSHGITQALTAQVEGHVSYLVVHAQRCPRAGSGQALPSLESAVVLGLANVGERPERLEGVAERLRGMLGRERLLDELEDAETERERAEHLAARMRKWSDRKREQIAALDAEEEGADDAE